MVDTYLVQKENRQGLPWNILQDFIRGHLYDEDGMIAFSLSIYGLVIFPGILGYTKMAMVDTFEQIQHGSNPSPAILANTFRSVNYYCRNQEGHFLGCTAGSWAISSVKDSPSQNLTFQGQLLSLSSVRILGHHQRQKNGGFHLSKIQVDYSGWPHRCPNPFYYTDAGTYPGCPFSGLGEWLATLRSLLWDSLGTNNSFWLSLG